MAENQPEQLRNKPKIKRLPPLEKFQAASPKYAQKLSKG